EACSCCFDEFQQTDYQYTYIPKTSIPFTGKELDSETGYSYFGARYIDQETISSFVSVDRFAHKYPFISPYSYCMYNPIKLTDLSGDTVIIRGEQADRAVAQLQTANMEVTREKDGILNVNLHGKTKDDLSRDERKIYDAIISDNVTVIITTYKTVLSKIGHLFPASINGKTNWYKSEYGGSNLGAYYFPETQSAETYGMIDMDMIEANGFDQGVAHEVSEHYLAGLFAIQDQTNIPGAIQNIPNQRMKDSHLSAIPATLPPGGMQQFGVKFGRLGKIKGYGVDYYINSLYH
ncbi:MAG: hypothetical protein II670_13025, partial [Alphaproteobacteria bacterium]|nr:hypothetical protein [Alphaproteobacteria bacterium]